jgi:hypothetical protein
MFLQYGSDLIGVLVLAHEKILACETDIAGWSDLACGRSRTFGRRLVGGGILSCLKILACDISPDRRPLRSDNTTSVRYGSVVPFAVW